MKLGNLLMLSLEDVDWARTESINRFPSFISVDLFVTPTDNRKCASPSLIAERYARSGVNPIRNNARLNRVIASRFNTRSPSSINQTLKQRNFFMGPKP